MTASTTLTRDRAVWIAYATVGLWGYVLYSMGPTLAALRDDLDVSRTQIGAVGTALALGSLAASLAASRLLVRWSQRALLCGACAAIGVAAVGFAVAPGLGWVLVVAAVLGAGGSLATIVVPLVIQARQPYARAVALTEANCVAGLLGAVAPLAIGAAIAGGAPWWTGLLVGAVAAAGVVALGRTLPPAPHVTAVAEAHDAPDGSRLGGPYWRWFGALVCGVAAEFCVSFWAVDYLSSEVRLSDASASGLLTVFVAGIGVGRLVGGRLAVTRAPSALVGASFAMLLAGALVFWAWATPAGSVAGLALLGLGVSVVYPMCLSLAIGAAPPNLAAPATTRAAVGASLAILAAPFVLGALADAVGPRRAFGLVPALAVVALMLVAGGRRGAR